MEIGRRNRRRTLGRPEAHAIWEIVAVLVGPAVILVLAAKCAEQITR